MIAERVRGIPWSKVPSWLLGDRLRILMYHGIADNPDDPNSVTPGAFADQMVELAHHDVRVISLEDGLWLLRQSVSLRGRVVITFDDAYVDFLTHALPVLERYRYPTTLFVPTGLVGGTAVWDSYDKTKRLLTWHELRECRRRGVAIGSHTVSHCRLTDCDDHQLRHEMVTSLETLRVELGEVFPCLAYPGGCYGAREQVAAQAAGYRCAVGVSSRWGNGPETDVYSLRQEKPGSVR